MKKVSIIFVLAIVLAGGAMGALPAPSQAQVYAQVYVPAPPPTPQLVAAPWVGNNTPWVYYLGVCFLNGLLYYFFGNQNAWAPYYAYAPTYIVRPNQWYAPRWNNWYKAHPTYWTNFPRQYPYWRDHQPGRHYDQNFYNKYHHGQGPGWQKGFQAGVHNPPPPATRNHPPEAAGPGHGHQTPAQPGQYQPGPPASRQAGQYQPGTPAARQPGQYQPAPPAAKQPGQTQPTPPASRQPGQYKPGGPASQEPGQYQPGTPAPRQPGAEREAPHRPPE